MSGGNYSEVTWGPDGSLSNGRLNVKGGYVEVYKSWVDLCAKSNPSVHCFSGRTEWGSVCIVTARAPEWAAEEGVFFYVEDLTRLPAGPIRYMAGMGVYREGVTREALLAEFARWIKGQARGNSTLAAWIETTPWSAEEKVDV